MAEVFATLIVPASKVHEARADGSCGFERGACPKNGPATATATHYVSSGKISEESAARLASLCIVVTGDHDPLQVVSDADLQLVQYPPLH